MPLRYINQLKPYMGWLLNREYHDKRNPTWVSTINRTKQNTPWGLRLLDRDINHTNKINHATLEKQIPTHDCPKSDSALAELTRLTELGQLSLKKIYILVSVFSPHEFN